MKESKTVEYREYMENLSQTSWTGDYLSNTSYRTT